MVIAVTATVTVTVTCMCKRSCILVDEIEVRCAQIAKAEYRAEHVITQKHCKFTRISPLFT